MAKLMEYIGWVRLEKTMAKRPKTWEMDWPREGRAKDGLAHKVGRGVGLRVSYAQCGAGPIENKRNRGWCLACFPERDPKAIEYTLKEGEGRDAQGWVHLADDRSIPRAKCDKLLIIGTKHAGIVGKCPRCFPEHEPIPGQHEWDYEPMERPSPKPPKLATPEGPKPMTLVVGKQTLKRRV